MARTERESDRRRREKKWQTLWCCRDQQKAFSEKTGTYWACRKGKSRLSATEKAVGKNAGAALAKRKRNKGVCPKHQIVREERVKVGESRTLARKKRIRARAWSGKGGLHRKRRQIPRRKGSASKKSLPRTSRRKHEQVSRRKSSPGRSAESWPHS